MFALKKRPSGAYYYASVAKKYKKTSKKKAPTYKHAADSGVTAVAPRAGPSNVLYTTFIYVQKFAQAGTVGGLAADQVFNLSSLFDPDFTGVGYQPVNFDQFALMYEKYLVLEVEIIAECCSGTTNVFQAGITVNDESTSQSDYRVLIGNGQCQWKLLQPQGGTDKARLTMTVDMAKFHGVTKKSYMADDSYKALMTASPQEAGFVHCWIADNGSSSTTTSNWLVELRYKVQLTGGKFNNVS